MKRTLFLLCILFYGHVNMAQSLMLDTASIRLQGGFFYTHYTGVYDNDGEKKITPRVTHSGFIIRGQAALNARWNVFLAAPVIIYNSVEASDAPGGVNKRTTLTKPGDAEIGIRYGFITHKEITACFTLWQSLGTGYRDKKVFLNTGFADFNTKLSFDLQYQKSEKLLFKTYMAFNNRNNDFSDEFHAGLMTNFRIYNNLSLNIYAKGVLSLENGSEMPELYLLGLYHNNWGILSSGLQINYEKNKGIGCYAGIDIPIRGQYVYASPLLEAGILIKLSADKKEKVQEDIKKSDSKELK